ncbi:MAG: hypothetical protein LW808_000785 [Verrucomicrobiota bacterium]|nr:MAG: hypothetical protein LW808_000785 [Verrucomicrobiota bacterium]
MSRYFSRQIQAASERLRLFLFLFLLSSSLFAGISITSDRLNVSFEDNASELTFSEHVHVTAPLFTADCTQARVAVAGKLTDFQSDLGSIRHVWITGPLSLTQEDRQCTADAAEIIPGESIILLKGNAVIRSSMGTVSAPMIKVNYLTKNVEVISDRGGSQPVQISIEQTELIATPAPEISAHQPLKPPDYPHTSRLKNLLQTPQFIVREAPPVI